jgi:lipid-binding SYLF domain-containing protein
MQRITQVIGLTLALFVGAGAAYADKYSDAETLFRNAGDSARFFRESYAYAVFPTVGEGAFTVGGAYGKGRVYLHGRYVGDTTMAQLTLGFQAGGKAYSEIVFFKDKRALDRFESGTFEFSAGASAVAITAGASASVATNGVTSGASGTEDHARTEGTWNDGMAVFTIAKGGLMYAAAIAGQKFSFKERGSG